MEGTKTHFPENLESLQIVLIPLKTISVVVHVYALQIWVPHPLPTTQHNGGKVDDRDFRSLQSVKESYSGLDPSQSQTSLCD